jgi:hypothetical protein
VHSQSGVRKVRAQSSVKLCAACSAMLEKIFTFEVEGLGR